MIDELFGAKDWVEQPKKVSSRKQRWDVKPKEKNGNHKGAHEAHHPHVLRGTAASIMRRTGLKSDCISFLGGWSTGAKEHYYNEDELSKEWQKECEPVFCFLREQTSEKVEGLQQRVTELEKGIETDRQIMEEQFLKPGMIAPRPKFETKKIDSNDEAALEKAVTEGFEPVRGLAVNGHIFPRRKIGA